MYLEVSLTCKDRQVFCCDHVSCPDPLGTPALLDLPTSAGEGKEGKWSPWVELWHARAGKDLREDHSSPAPYLTPEETKHPDVNVQLTHSGSQSWQMALLGNSRNAFLGRKQRLLFKGTC